ncbi:hypothetical protein [Noviherbaspirillum humi]|nr:hypothetical protein [Noviherbaspirillum humi]
MTKPAVLIAALAFAALASFEASAAVTVKGQTSCGQWARQRSAHGPMEAANKAWLLGFLSGASAANDEDALGGTDPEVLFQWTDAFCRKNHTADIDDAAAMLYRELIRITPKSK